MSTSTSGSSQARLLRRAQLVARTQHPNLVPLMPLPGGAGLAPVLTGLQRLADFDPTGSPFRAFEPEHAVQLLLDVLNGLSALHDLVFEGTAFVHGAVSPGYVCVDGHGSARLISLVSSRVMPSFPLEASGYVAPECLIGGSVDCRADIFSVGVLLWEALARCRLFPDPSPAAIMSRLLSGALPRLTPPPGTEWAKPLYEVAGSAIASDPGDRYPTAREFSGAIVAAAGPRLTLRLGERWQDEAPTLVPARRSYVPPRRSWTPPGVAIDLSPGNSQLKPPPPAPPARASVPPPLPTRASVPPPLPARASVPPPLPARASLSPAVALEPSSMPLELELITIPELELEDCVPTASSIEPSQLARSGRGLAERRVRAAVLGLGALFLLLAAWLLRPPRGSLASAPPASAPATLAPATLAPATLAPAALAPAALPAASTCVPPVAESPAIPAPSTQRECWPGRPAAPRDERLLKPGRAKSRSLPNDADYGI